MTLYWAVNKKGERTIVVAPIYAHCFVLLLSLVWPIARHTWIVILVAWIMMIYEMYADRKAEGIS